MSNIQISITKNYVTQKSKLLSILVIRVKLMKNLVLSKKSSLNVFSNKDKYNNKIAAIILL